MLCNLAVSAMEDIQDESPGLFTFSVVDASTREGVKRLQELRPTAGRQIPVPGVMMDGGIVFDRIPDMEEFGEWLEAQAQRID
ncbi:MAG: thioredoxin-like (seleno)protein [Thermoleophilia bacterium]